MLMEIFDANVLKVNGLNFSKNFAIPSFNMIFNVRWNQVYLMTSQFCRNLSHPIVPIPLCCAENMEFLQMDSVVFV